MFKKTHSQGLNYEFTVVFDAEKETQLQKIKRWIAKKQPPLRTILEHLFSFVEKWYWEGKELQTKQQIDQEVEYVLDVWNKEDERSANKTEIVEEGLFGEETWSISISNPVVERGFKESNASVGHRSDEERLGNPFPDPWDGDWNDGVWTWQRINKLNSK